MVTPEELTRLSDALSARIHGYEAICAQYGVEVEILTEPTLCGFNVVGYGRAGESRGGKWHIYIARGLGGVREPLDRTTRAIRAEFVTQLPKIVKAVEAAASELADDIARALAAVPEPPAVAPRDV